MGIKSVIRKAAELGVGITAITVLVLAGCGGGGGSSSAAPSSFLNVGGSLGQFNGGTHIRVRDRDGTHTGDGFVDTTGFAKIDVTGFNAPMLVSVLPDSNTGLISYYDEKANAVVSAVAPSTGAIRALIPNAPTAGTPLPVGVTPLTEMAVGLLAQGSVISSTGALPPNFTSTNALAAANTVGTFFGMSASAVLSPPAIIGASSVPLTDLTSAANQYALKLAALANMAAAGHNALDVSKALTSSFQTGTFGTGLAASGILNGVTVSTTALPTNTFSTALINAMTAAAGNASQVSHTALMNDLTAATGTVPPAPTASVTSTISGSVSGLTGTVVLQDNNGDNLIVMATGASSVPVSFTFATPIVNGGTYNVTVANQPTGLTCSPSSNTGTVSGNPVTSVRVVCSLNPQKVGGTISGLTGTVVLQDNGGDNLTVTSGSSTFTFATPVASSSPYAVTVATQPTGQTCTVANGSGTISTTPVTNVAVTCVTNTYSIGGTVSGLTGGAAGGVTSPGSVVLKDLNGGTQIVPTNGSFSLPSKVAYGSSYNVTVSVQPSGQTCTVTSGSGTVTGNVSNVTVTCGLSTSVSAAIASGKTLLSSLTTTVNVLGSKTTTGTVSSISGFLPTQASGVQADLTASTGAFGEVKDFLKFATNAVGLLRSGIGASTNLYTVYSNGYPGDCMVQVTGTVVCQWVKQNIYGALATHQLTVTGPAGSPGSTLLPTSGAPLNYTWADMIISNSDPFNTLSTTVAITLPTVATAGVSTRPLIPTTAKPNPTTTSPANGSATGTLSVAVGSTGTLTFTNGNINPGSSAVITFSGYTLPGALSPSVPGTNPVTGATNIKIDHSYQNVTVTLSAATAGTILQGTVGFNAGSVINRVDNSGNIVNSITFGTAASTVVDDILTGTPVSANLALIATTPNYSFSGTINMSSFAQDASPFCPTFINGATGLCNTSTGNWYPQTTTFTGSVTGVNANATLGKFMTTTGTGLSVTMNETASTTTGYKGYNPSQPTSSTNYQIESATFSGNIVDAASIYGTSPYQIALAESNGNSVTSYNTGVTLNLTYTDPTGKAVTVNITGTSPTAQSTGEGILGTSGIAVVMGTGGNGTVYSGYTSAVTSTTQGYIPSTSTGTVIGSISKGMVSFIDGTTQSLQ